MRELKFKVWDTVRQSMFKPQGVTFDIKSLAPFAVKVSGRSWEPAGKFEILQWTGLCDDNDNEVYEGDFVKISSEIYEVIWSEAIAGFELIEPEASLKRSINDAAMGYIIGNKFENPNLQLGTGTRGR